MTLPIKYRKSPASTISVNFEDIASGTGYIKMYGSALINNGTDTVYRLSNFVHYGNTTYVQVSAQVNTESAKIIDVDFDVLLNKPLVLQGQAVVNLCYYVLEAGSDQYVSTYIVAKLRKYSGSTETEIASGTSNTYVHSVGAHFGLGFLKGIVMTVPLTSYKIGDYLRLTIEVYAHTVAGGSYTYTFFCDPTNTTNGLGTGSTVSVLQMLMPVRVEA